ncbi:DUF721 domain-containing protein [Streptomyces scabiei]|uniref:DUF721 domain-containing protein n=1 Tax=Streptomyces scabiei TaxID=1930 RepID=UPI0033F1EB8A
MVTGVDLARVALRAAMEQARKNGGGQKTKQKSPRVVRTVRRDGREPIGLGAAIGALVTERAWELPAAGATLRQRWEAIAPELAGHVAVVGYNADFGQLTVCPESSAWATKARLEQICMIAAANSRRAGQSSAPCGSRRSAPSPRPSRATPHRPALTRRRVRRLRRGRTRSVHRRAS